MPPIAPDSDTLRLIFPGSELRAVRAEGKPTMLVGYAARYNSWSPEYYGFRERVAPGAFARALKGEDDVRALWNHDSAQVLGRTGPGTLRLRDDPQGLIAEIDLPASPLGENARVAVERGDVSQMSFQFRKLKDEWTEEEVEGRTVTSRTLLELRLIDVSPVAFPWYPDTSIVKRCVEEGRGALRTPRRDNAGRLIQLIDAAC